MIGSFLKTTAVYGVSNAIIKLIDYFLLTIFVGIYVPEEYAQISLVTIIIGALTSVFSLSIEGAISRYYYEYKGKKFKVYLGSIISYSVIVALLLGGIFIFCTEPFWKMAFKEITFNPLIVLGMLIASVDPINRVYLALIKIKRDVKLYAFFFNAYMLIRLFALLAVSLIEPSVENYFLTYLLCTSLFSLISFYNLGKLSILNFRFQHYKHAVSYSIYALPVLLIGVTNGLIDRYFVLEHLSLEQMGVYSLGATFGQIVLLVATMLNQSYVSFFMQSYQNNSEIELFQKISNLSQLLFFIVSIFSLFFIFLSPMFHLFLDSEYTGMEDVLWIFAFTGIGNSIYFFMTNFLSLEKELMKFKFWGLLTGTVLNIVFSILLIPKFGIQGPAYGTLISIFVSGFVLKWIINKRTKFSLPNTFFLISIILFGIIITIFSLRENYLVFYSFAILILLGYTYIMDKYAFDGKNYLIKQFKKLIRR
jgi:O-antigen/teichoic acid export membrane protein